MREEEGDEGVLGRVLGGHGETRVNHRSTCFMYTAPCLCRVCGCATYWNATPLVDVRVWVGDKLRARALCILIWPAVKA